MIEKNRLWAYAGMAVTTALVAGIGFEPHIFFPQFEISENLTLHAVLETFGALVSILIGFLLLFQWKETDQGGRFFPVAVAFLGMGLLDCIHVWQMPGREFVLTHTLVVLVGGFGFSLAWFPWPAGNGIGKGIKWAFLASIAGLVFLSFLFLLKPEIFPVSFLSGIASPAVEMLNPLGGILFLIGAICFFRVFHRTGQWEDYLFGLTALLFGIAGFLFKRYPLWDEAWWFWHFVRAIAYSFLLIFFLRQYFEMIISLKRTCLQLEQAKRSSEVVLNAVLDIFYLFDLEGRFLIWNKALQKVSGYSDREIFTMRPTDFFDKEDALHIQAAIEKARKEGSASVEVDFVTKSGQRIPYELTGSVLKDAAGHVTGIAGSGRDLTKRRSAERKLKEKGETLNAITSSSQDAILMMNPEGLVSFWNPAAERIFGWTAREIIGENLHAILAPQRYHEVHKKAFSRFQVTGEGAAIGKTLELNAIKKDGTEFIMELSLSTVQLDGKWHAVGIVRDITERKQAEEALRKAHDELEIKVRDRTAESTRITERLRLATDGSGIGTWHWNILTGELACSDKCKAIYGLAPNETISYPRFIEALHPEDREKTDRAVHAALEGHKEYDVEYRSIWPDGSVHWIAAKGRGYSDDSGKAVRMEGVVIDITNRKNAERELTERYDQLERFRKATIDREFRMKELQNEIERLKADRGGK